ncbi:hypothetical protein MNBD_GAMMA12-3408 [hydrothermal vent metagenome]|uniref:Uncharacterized protein n=1 Tax=hydrothermal vent metagenome TaxID=652676 RepID=A0A3B0YWB4_9ZZZZ
MVVGGVLGTIFLLFSFAWALLPGGFGIKNFKKKRGGILYLIGLLFWLLLLLIHPLIVYLLWSGLLNHKDIVFSWLFLPLLMQIIFFTVFGRNVGT